MFSFPIGVVSNSSAVPSWAAWDGSADGINYDTFQQTYGAGVIGLSSTSFLIIMPYTGSLYARVGVINGTVISYGLLTDLNVTGVPAPANISNYSIDLLDTNKIIVSMGTHINDNCYAVVATISGTIISPGDVVRIVTLKSQEEDSQEIVALSPTKAFFAYTTTTGSIDALVLSISGTTISINAISTIYTYQTPVTAVSFDTDKIIILFAANSTTYASARVITISGVNIDTLGPILTLESTSMGQDVGYLSVINNTEVAAFYLLGQLRAMVLSISGTTITPNTPAIVNTATAGQTPLWLELLNNTELMAVYQTMPSGPFLTNARVITINGTTLVPHAEVQIQSGSNATTQAQPISKMDGNTVVNSFTRSTGRAAILKRA